MIGFIGDKRHVASLTMQQNAAGEFTGKYGFELELEQHPMPDMHDEVQGAELEAAPILADAGDEIQRAAGELHAESERRRLVPNRDVYALDGKPKNPTHHQPAATLKTLPVS